MKQLKLKTDIQEGKDIEVEALFDGSRRKIVQITLRQNAILKAHKAAEPITIQCIVGEGVLLDVEKEVEFDLKPGVLVTVEPNVVHEIRAKQEVSMLLSRFKEV